MPLTGWIDVNLPFSDTGKPAVMPSPPKLGSSRAAADYRQACRDAELAGTFTGLGLARAGVQIEMVDGSRHLLGDVAADGGAGNDDRAFEATDVVVRYRVLVNPTQEESPIDELARVKELLRGAFDHLDYCNWGDSWERECSVELQRKLEAYFAEEESKK